MTKAGLLNKWIFRVFTDAISRRDGICKNIKILLLFFFQLPASAQFTGFVNPFIGTGGHGHTFPGAVVPFGMVALSPDTRVDGSWDGCSGYHYDDSLIYGFSHTHLSGTGCSDLGDVAFLPLFGQSSNLFSYMLDTLRVGFSHKNEQAVAGFYQVKMDNGIRVELTASQRAGFQRYNAPADGYMMVVLNMQHRDELLQGRLIKVDNQTYKGLRRSKAWAKHQQVYFCSRLSKDPEQAMIVKDEKGNDARLYMLFRVKAGENIIVKTGLSGVDEEGAQLNLDTEIPHWDINQTYREADAAWNKELGCINVLSHLSIGEGQGVRPDKDKLTIFYTALYHCFTHPSIHNDVDHRYRGRDNQIHTAEGFDYYTVFSLWDTYRALHPLFNMVQRKRNLDFIKTFLAHYDQVGRLPIWELWGNETDCMIGYHAVSVIADAYRSGIRDFDVEKAYKAMSSIANSNWRGLDIYRQKGYLEVDDEPESVSKTLEYSYDDYCIYQLFHQNPRLIANSQAVTDTFSVRSKFAMNLFNPELGIFQPRKNGGWLKAFNPIEVSNHYTEANGWQYGFGAQHLYRYATEETLDALFSALGETGRKQADITGLIGQYAHGNEPSHHLAFLFSILNRQSKTDSLVGYIRQHFYKNTPDGLIGNEDCGQMSAWYVWAALGKYPVCPGDHVFAACKPLYHVATFDSLKAPHFDRKIMSGWVRNDMPMVLADNLETFDKSVTIQLKNYQQNSQAYCFIQFDDTLKKPLRFLYREPYELTEPATVKFFKAQGSSKLRNIGSGDIVAHFHKLPNDYSVHLISQPRKSYAEQGGQTLTDGLRGNSEWRRGRWLGFQYEDFEAVLDLQKTKKIDSLFVGFLQDQSAWIMLPKSVSFYTSTDGITYTEAGTVTHSVPDTASGVVQKNLGLKLPKTTKVRYVKVKTKTYGKLPAWHPGRGDDALIFVDEIWVR